MFFSSFCWQVQLNMTKQSIDSQKTNELTAFMGLASEVLQGNVLLYGIEIDHSKVFFKWDIIISVKDIVRPKCEIIALFTSFISAWSGMNKRSSSIQEEPRFNAWSGGLKRVLLRIIKKKSSLCISHWVRRKNLAQMCLTRLFVVSAQLCVMKIYVWICPVCLRLPLKTLRQQREWL